MSSALGFLSTLLQDGSNIGKHEIPDRSGIDGLLQLMLSTTRGRKSFSAPESQQAEAIRRFWPHQSVDTFRDLYLLSWGLCIPHRTSGECVLESERHLERVLSYVDDYQSRPAAFRRCYQGLVKGYFQYSYRSRDEEKRDAARRNWPMLREFLEDRIQFIGTERVNPTWVQTAQENRALFGADPCARFIDGLLQGDSSVVDHVCEQLQISQSSWFQERLVMGQIRTAASKDDSLFLELLPRLLTIEMFTANAVLRNTAMQHLLDRYAEVPNRPLHPQLRDLSVAWWGNPWLPSNETSWGGVSVEARTMVSDWLKEELIEAFFTKLADDGLADPRRMNFWKRYVKAMRHIEFALGPTAKNSTEADFVALRRKMKGLICELEGGGSNNAFIMDLGPIVGVEFGDAGAFYAYHEGQLPFNTKLPLRLPVNGRNSLKHRQHAMRETHHGALDSWNPWEQNFERQLRQKFGILPDGEKGMSLRVQRSHQKKQATDSEFSVEALTELASSFGLSIDDKTDKGGNLWVRGVGTDNYASRKLASWGFNNRPDKGWWK